MPKQIPDEAFVAAAKALAAVTPEGEELYPALGNLRMISRAIAIAVLQEGGAGGWAPAIDTTKIEELVDAAMWRPTYRPYVPA